MLIVIKVDKVDKIVNSDELLIVIKGWNGVLLFFQFS